VIYSELSYEQDHMGTEHLDEDEQRRSSDEAAVVHSELTE